MQVLENNILEKEQVKYKKLVPPKIHEKIDETNKKNKVSKPKWIRVKLPIGKKYTDLRNLVDKYKKLRRYCKNRIFNILLCIFLNKIP